MDRDRAFDLLPGLGMSQSAIGSGGSGHSGQRRPGQAQDDFRLLIPGFHSPQRNRC